LEFRPESDSKDFLSTESYLQVFKKFSDDGIIFDKIFFRDPCTKKQAIEQLSSSIKKQSNEKLAAEGFQVIISQRIPNSAQHIGKLVENQVLNPQSAKEMEETFEKLEKAENEFFTNQENPLFNWDEKTFCQIFENAGFTVKCAVKPLIEKRRISQQEIYNWFDGEKSAYGSFIAQKLGVVETEKIKNLLVAAAKNTIFTWETKLAFFVISVK